VALIIYDPYNKIESDYCINEYVQSKNHGANIQVSNPFVKRGRATLKSLLHFLLGTFWLRENTVRRGIIGPYRNIYFELNPPMRNRLSVFYRPYEEEVSEWINQYVKPDMTIYVLGAHVGIHVLYIAELLKERGKVYAFEGWEENYRGLEKNLDLNPSLSHQIIAINQCITKETGPVYMVEGSSDGRNHIVNDTNATSNTIEIDGIALDDFWDNTGDCVDLIIMDIEGAEGDALAGAETLIATCHPQMMVEHHGKKDQLTDWLVKRGYHVESIDSRHITATIKS